LKPAPLGVRRIRDRDQVELRCWDFLRSSEADQEGTSCLDRELVGQRKEVLVTGGAITYNRMVVSSWTGEEVDRLFHALADATRRDILHRCTGGEPSVSRLADVYPMSFAAVQKHVAVLERAGLVTKERRGREQLVHTDLAAVDRARHVLDELEQTWRGRAERMSAVLARRPRPRKTNSEEDTTG
jgi:DNA-binding transcriptional ArsR family regulator